MNEYLKNLLEKHLKAYKFSKIKDSILNKIAEQILEDFIELPHLRCYRLEKGGYQYDIREVLLHAIRIKLVRTMPDYEIKATTETAPEVCPNCGAKIFAYLMDTYTDYDCCNCTWTKRVPHRRV